MSIRFECYCLKLETKNGKVFGFVSLDIPVTIEGLEYSPIGGVDSTASNQPSRLEIDNIQCFKQSWARKIVSFEWVRITNNQVLTGHKYLISLTQEIKIKSNQIN